MHSNFIGICWQCGQHLTSADYGREADCPKCGRDTRVCRNCRHYARGRPNDCVEPMAEPVLAKDRANFCELFEPSDRPPSREAAEAPSQEALREAAEALFRK